MAELFTEVYNQLPLCHCINNQILVSIPVVEVIVKCISLNMHSQFYNSDNYFSAEVTY